MRTNLIPLFTILIVSIGCIRNNSNYITIENIPITATDITATHKIDSVFTYYFNVLDSSLVYIKNVQANPREVERLMDVNDTIGLKHDYELSINFLELITGLKAKSTTTYFPTKILDEQIVNEWKQWYQLYHSKLIWEYKSSRVNRSDKNIYNLTN